MKSKTKFWIFSGIFIAVVFIVTYSIKIPLFTGYFNIGDVIIMICAILFGKNMAFIAGGFGSGLADLASGYVVYAPFTFIIKGFEGYICSLIFKSFERSKKSNQGFIISTLIAGIIMAVGYFLVESFVLKYISSTLNVNRDLQFGFRAALVNFPFNLLQGVLSAVVATILAGPMYKNEYLRKLRKWDF